MIPGFEADTACGGKVLVVRLDGRIPRDAVSEANEILVSLLAKQCVYLILDCSRLREVGSKGVGLVAYHAAALRRKGGELLIVPPEPEVLRRVGGEILRSIARFAPSFEHALKHVREVLSTTMN